MFSAENIQIYTWFTARICSYFLVCQGADAGLITGKRGHVILVWVNECHMHEGGSLVGKVKTERPFDFNEVCPIQARKK